MKQKRVIPAFKSEAEEAEWWHKNRARLDKDRLEAASEGETEAARKGLPYQTCIKLLLHQALRQARQ